MRRFDKRNVCIAIHKQSVYTGDIVMSDYLFNHAGSGVLILSSTPQLREVLE